MKVFPVGFFLNYVSISLIDLDLGSFPLYSALSLFYPSSLHPPVFLLFLLLLTLLFRGGGWTSNHEAPPG